MDNLKVKNFSMFVGRKKLLNGLKAGAAGCISATTNVTGAIARKVYDDFKKYGNPEDAKLQS